MIAVVQRVNSASVGVEGDGVVGSIGHGLCVLVCAVEGDGPEDLEWMAGKIARLRIFSNDEGRFDLSVRDVRGEVLLVSQFTLAGDCRKGNRPSFIQAAEPLFWSVQAGHRTGRADNLGRNASAGGLCRLSRRQ